MGRGVFKNIQYIVLYKKGYCYQTSVLNCQAEVWVHFTWCNSVVWETEITVTFLLDSAPVKNVCTGEFVSCVLNDVDKFVFFLPPWLDHQICSGPAQSSKEPPAQRSAKETPHSQVQKR